MKVVGLDIVKLHLIGLNNKIKDLGRIVIEKGDIGKQDLIGVIELKGWVGELVRDDLHVGYLNGLITLQTKQALFECVVLQNSRD